MESMSSRVTFLNVAVFGQRSAQSTWNVQCLKAKYFNLFNNVMKKKSIHSIRIFELYACIIRFNFINFFLCYFSTFLDFFKFFWKSYFSLIDSLAVSRCFLPKKLLRLSLLYRYFYTSLYLVNQNKKKILFRFSFSLLIFPIRLNFKITT